MLKKDLQSNDCELLFYNWTIQAAGVVCRWEPKLKDSFIYGKNTEEVVREHLKGLTYSDSPEP